MQKQIARACLTDYNDYIDKILVAMEAAEAARDHSEIRRLLELVGKKMKKAGGYAKPTTDANGDRMFDIEKEAEQWAVHLKLESQVRHCRLALGRYCPFPLELQAL